MASSSSISSSSDKISNVTLTEQRDMPITQILPSQSSDTSFGHSLTNSDTIWSLEQTMSREILESQIEWPVTALPFTALYGYTDFPTAVSQDSTKLQAIFLSFMTYFTFNVRIRFKINSTKFHQGALIANWIPGKPSGLTQYAQHLTPTYLSSSPNAILKADTSESVVFDIPYAHIHSSYLLSSVSMSSFVTQIRNLGVLELRVLNQLQCVSGASQSVGITSYVSFVNPQLLIPVNPRSAPLFNQRYQNSNQPFQYSTRRDLPVIIEAQAADTVSAIGNTVGSFLSAGKSAVSTLALAESGDVPGAISSGISTVEKAVSAFSSLSNFDKPNENQFSSNFIRATINNPSLGSGQDCSQELNLKCHTAHIVAPQYFGSNQCDMDVNDLVKRATLYKTLSWSQTSLSGALLYSEMVAPTSFAGSSIVSTLGTVITPTWLSSISSLFTQWRGTIRFRLQVLATQFHSGSLLISFTPNVLSDPPSTVNAAMQSNHILWDLKEKHEIIFDCGYNMTTPWLSVPTYQQVNYTRAVDLLSITSTTYECYSGYINIFVVNPLVGITDVVNQVDVNLWVLAGDGFELTKPAQINHRLELPHWPPATTFDDSSIIEAQALDDDAEGTNTQMLDIQSSPAEVLQLDPSTTLPIDVHYLGDSVISLKDVCRRATRIPPITLTIPSGSTCAAIAIPVLPWLSSIAMRSTTAQSTYLTGYAPSALEQLNSHFAWWSGKLNYKVIIEASTNYYPVTASATHLPDQYFMNSNLIPVYFSSYNSGIAVSTGVPSPYDMTFQSGYASHAWSSDIQTAMDLVIPWSQPNSAANTDFQTTVLGVNSLNFPLQTRFRPWREFMNGTLMLNFHGPVNTAFTIHLYYGAGDDFSFYVPVAPPSVVLATDTLGLTLTPL
jgi:hypothetical protein